MRIFFVFIKSFSFLFTFFLTVAVGFVLLTGLMSVPVRLSVGLLLVGAVCTLHLPVVVTVPLGVATHVRVLSSNVGLVIVVILLLLRRGNRISRWLSMLFHRSWLALLDLPRTTLLLGLRLVAKAFTCTLLPPLLELMVLFLDYMILSLGGVRASTSEIRLSVLSRLES